MTKPSRRTFLHAAASSPLWLSALSIAPAGTALANPALRSALQRIESGAAAPDFMLSDLDGNAVRFSAFKGKVAIVNFWATWCPPCRQEIPSMERAWKQLKDKDVVLLAVHVGGDMEKIWAFANEFNITFPVLVDKSSKVSRDWQTVGLPTTFVTDPEGRKALRAVGDREWDNPAILAEILGLRKTESR
jgi:peroxiredoxin